MMIDELLHFSGKHGKGLISIQMVLSLFRDDFPWIYDAGIDTIRILKSRCSEEEKHNAIIFFEELLEFSFEHPMLRKFAREKDYMIMRHEFPHLIIRAMHLASEDF